MNICFFGESYVNGVGDPTQQGWVSRLCASAISKGHDITAHNCGVRGATSTLVRSTWNFAAASRLPATDKGAVVFSYGTNDCWRENGEAKVLLETHIDNTLAILEEASACWPTLFVGPPGLPAYSNHTMREDDHATRCELTKGLCADLGIPYFDTLAVYGQFEKWHAEAKAGDGAHPGAGGYAEMAAALDMWTAWKNLLT